MSERPSSNYEDDDFVEPSKRNDAPMSHLSAGGAIVTTSYDASQAQMNASKPEEPQSELSNPPLASEQIVEETPNP